MDHLNVVREQIFNSVLENRVSVTATDFHDLESPVGQTRDLPSEPARDFSLPVFINEFHLERTPPHKSPGLAVAASSLRPPSHPPCSWRIRRESARSRRRATRLGRAARC